MIDAMLSNFARFPIPDKLEQLERARQVRRWLDWEGGPDKAPPSVRRTGMRARERLVSGNMRLCVNVAKKLPGMGMPLEDLIQEGALGLMRAVDGFDPTRGYTFGTYAYWWVRQAMTRALGETADMIRIPTNALEILFRVQRHIASAPNPPTEAELLQISGMDSMEKFERIRAAVRAKRCGSTSVLLPDEKRSLEEILTCPNSHHEIQEESLEVSLQMDRLHLMLPHLSDEEVEIIELRYLNELPNTEIARMLGINAERVSKTANKALAKLKRLASLDDCEQTYQGSLF